MHRSRRLAPWLGLALLLATAVPAAAAVEGHVELYWSEAILDRVPLTSPALDAPAPACDDRAHNLAGGRWNKTLRWSFRASSTPAGLARSEALRVIKRGYGNIVNARNVCGRPDQVSATATYLGRTTARPNCSMRDGRNVVGFRSLASNVLARTCWWVSNGSIIEADIQINNGFSWATTLAGCRFQPMLEAVMTHEAGHAFGMGHVGEKRHGRLTMSTRLDGNCNNQEASLGLGDLIGLEKLY
ncbi:MAG TPA: hypothetical protein VMP67_10810 [Candidatus Limnocylindria bacterium]|nr:hypothetical protein [Candidatus Limnocylindria bacterium]